MTRHKTGINGRMTAVTISQANRNFLEMRALAQGKSMHELLTELVPDHLTGDDVAEMTGQRKQAQAIDKHLAQLVDLLLTKTKKKYGKHAEGINRSIVVDHMLTKLRTKGRKS